MKIRTTASVLAVAALTLGLAACGGDDEGGGDAADSPVAAAIASEIMSDSEDSPVASQEEADCWAGRIVSGVGEDRLEELGVTESNVGELQDIAFTDDEIGVIVDSMFECVDVRGALAEEFEGDFGAEGAQCVADNLDEDLVKTLMRSEFAGDDAEMPDEFFQAFLDIAAECDLPLE